MHATRFWVAMLACAGLIFAAFSPVGGAEGSKTITIVQTAEPKSFDPSGTYLSHEENVGTQIMEPIVWLDSDLKPDPRLALSWRNVEPLVWELKLRTGVRFTNGERFNADAVVASFDYMTRADSAQKARFTNWEAVQKVDDATVRVRTKTPDPRFLTTLIQLYIMPPGVLRSKPNSLVENPVGTGPFKLARWDKGQQIVLEANPGYWRGRPKVDRIVFKAVPEASARVAALLARQADLILNVPTELVDLLDRGPNTKILSAPSTRGVPIIFDSRTPPFNDVRVRQALNYAIDRESLNRNFFGGRALIMATTSHPTTSGHNTELKPYPYDPQKAKDLLTQAGYPTGFEIEFHHPTGRWLKDSEVAQAMAGMLEQVGLRPRLRTGEYNSFFAAWQKGDLKGMTMIGVLSQVDADRTVQLFLYSKGSNSLYSRDPSVDTRFEAAQTLDLQKREQLLKEMEVYIQQQALWLFTYWQPDLFGASRKLTWKPPRNERLVLWNIDLE